MRMFHVGYISTIIIPVSFGCILFRRREKLKAERKTMICAGFTAIVLVAYQAYIFLTVHYKNSGTQTGTYISSFVSGAQHILCGQAVMPVSPAGILLIVGEVVLFIYFVINLKEIMKAAENQIFLFPIWELSERGLEVKLEILLFLLHCRESF